MKLILIRHGETEWNRIGRYQGQSDVELSKEGKFQVKCLIKSKELNSINIIYTSDLKRAYQTAEQIAKKYKIKNIIKTDKLREMNYGVWEGKTIDEVKKEYSRLLKKWRNNLLTTKIPQGETIMQFQKRVISWFEEVILNSQFSILNSVLIVSHGGPIRIIISYCLGMKLEKIRNLRIDNGSISVLERFHNTWQLSLLNDTCHIKKSSV